jgi:5-methylcytosine-specific restriction endonuclease McrA
MVDHIKPIKNGGDLMAMDNLQSLCVSCHNRKKAKEMKG